MNKIFKIILIVALLLITSTICFIICQPPRPNDSQIIEAIRVSSEMERSSLDLDYGGLIVAHRYPGKANAVLWTRDESIQRNYSILYDKKLKSFYVNSFTTSVKGEDGVYRFSD